MGSGEIPPEVVEKLNWGSKETLPNNINNNILNNIDNINNNCCNKLQQQNLENELDEKFNMLNFLGYKKHPQS